VGELDELQSGDPQYVGPYRLLGRLGSGGMGRVFLGQSPGGRYVAVKVIRAELADQADFRIRFAREVAAARRVSGLFTAPAVDADLDAPAPWLATAYVAGPSLSDAVASHGPLPVSSVLALAAGLAEGLGAIHAAGIVHRDLKPSNVLLAEDGPRVIDFGISRAAEQFALTGTGLVIGSPGFMSPEQAQGHEVGPPSDVFSLGAVLTFAAIGEGPFGSGSTVVLLYRVVSAPPATEALPAELRPLIERCLAKDPQQRPSTGDLLSELNASPEAGWLPTPVAHGLPTPAAHGLPTPAVHESPTTVAHESPTPVPHESATPVADGSATHPPTMAGTADGSLAKPVPDSAGSTGSRGGRGRFSRKAIIAILAVAALALAGVAAGLTLPHTSSPKNVALQSVRTPGPNPFTPSVGTDQPGVRSPKGTGGTFPGGTPGLYRGTLQKTSCNPQQMVGFLRAHPDKAAAWAGVLGIRPAGIPRYVASLTPVVLRSDTAVTNHGYVDGHATSFPAVLQAGTAVLIDRHGQPVTKCFCGNPLTMPMSYTQPVYTGKRWGSFSPASVTDVQRTTVSVSSFILVDLATGGTFRRQPDGADQPVSTQPVTGPQPSPSQPSSSQPQSTPTSSQPSPSQPSPSQPTPSQPQPTPTPTPTQPTPSQPSPSQPSPS
jgi:serine/threonine protein kinase